MPTALTTARDLLEALRDSRVLPPAELDRLLGDPQLCALGAKALAGELLRRDALTAYQANQLFLGKGGDLVLGPYVLLERVGQGGMGSVFKARHSRLGRIVALKVIRKERLASPDAVRRFRREIQAAAQLNHPNVVVAYDAEEAAGTHYLAMEFVEGADLARLVKEKGPLPVARACEYVRQAALGLQHAHEQGLVHRDVKPSNLLLGPDGQVKVLDLGLARLNAVPSPECAESVLTETGAVMGTPDYIAPEQVEQSNAVDVRADVYSLGCTLYHLLAGAPPFAGFSMGKKLACHLATEPPRLENVRPDVPAALGAVVRKMMAKRPEDRYQVPGEVAQALAALPEAPPRGVGAALVPPPAVPQAPIATLAPQETAVSLARLAPEPRRARWWFGGAAAVLALAGALAWGLSGARRPPPPPGPEPVPVPAQLPPLDRLSASAIPAEERFAWQPAELVAVFGNHRGRHVGPRGEVMAVAWAPDGTLAASADCGGTIFLWDAQTGRERQRIVLSGARGVHAVAFDRRSKLLAFGDTKGGTHLWERTATGFKSRADLTGHADKVTGVAFSPDGSTLASASADRTVRLWGLSRFVPETIAVLKGHLSDVRQVAFSPDGQTLASASEDRTVRLRRRTDKGWADAATIPHESGVRCLAFAADGTLATGCRDGTLRLWDVGKDKASQRAVVRAHAGRVDGLGFSPDGLALATAGDDGEVRVWRDLRATELVEMTVLKGHRGGTSGIAFSPDGRGLVSGGGDYSVRFWAHGPGGWKERRPLIGHVRAVTGVAFLEDGLATGSADGTVRRWRLPGENGEAPVLLTTGATQPRVASLPEANLMAASVGPNVLVWELTREEAGPPVERARSGLKVGSLVWSAHRGRRLAFGNGKGEIAVLNLAPSGERRALARFAANAQPVTALAFSPGDQVLAAGGADGAVRLWREAGDGWIQRSALSGHKAALAGLAFTPNGKLLISADGAGSVRLWDVQPARPHPARPVLARLSAAVTDLALSPDGKTLAVAVAGGRLTWWDVASWEKRGERGLPFGIGALAFAPDGRHLATGNENGTVYVLRLAPAPEGPARP